MRSTPFEKERTKALESELIWVNSFVLSAKVKRLVVDVAEVFNSGFENSFSWWCQKMELRTSGSKPARSFRSSALLSPFFSFPSLFLASFLRVPPPARWWTTLPSGCSSDTEGYTEWSAFTARSYFPEHREAEELTGSCASITPLPPPLPHPTMTTTLLSSQPC